MKNILIILFLILCYSKSFGIDLKGFVIDESTQERVIGATVKIESLNIGSYTNGKGEFKFSNFNVGKYTLTISYIGYEKKSIDLNLTSSDSTYVISLTPKSLLQSKIIVTANKKVQTIQEVPISVSVVDLQTINNRNQTDVDDILQYVPGIQMNGDQVSIRGASGFALGVGSRVAFLIDGFPMLSGDQGDIKYDIIPPFNIDRVEVVKGGGSALYGTGALGGVINLIIETPLERSFKTKIYSGFYTKTKYDSWHYADDTPMFSGVDLSYSDEIEDISVLLAGRFLSDDSYRDFDDRQNFSLFSKVTTDITDNNLLTINASFTRNKHSDWVYWKSLNEATIPPDGTDKSLAVTSDKATCFVNWKHLFGESNILDFKSGILFTSYGNNDNKNNPDYRGSEALSYYNELQLNYFLYPELFLTSGLTSTYNIVESNLFGENYQFNSSIYAQAEWTIFKEFILTYGMRGDFERIMGSEYNIQTSPKVGMIYKLLPNLSIRASYGKGFRTATIAEKYAAFNFGPFKVKENIDIEPEVNFSVEAGMNFIYSGNIFSYTFDASLFRNDLRNMIEPIFIESQGEPFIQFRNVQDAHVQGVELDFQSMLYKMIVLQTSLTLMNTYDYEAHSELKYRSNILWYNSISLNLESITVQTDYRFMSRPNEVDEMLKLFIPNADERVNAHVVDFRIIYDLKEIISEELQLVLNVKNILDYYYTLYPGNLAPTRSVSVHLNVKF